MGTACALAAICGGITLMSQGRSSWSRGFYPRQMYRSPQLASLVLLIFFAAVGVLCGMAFQDEINVGSITAFLAHKMRGTSAGTLFSIVNVLVTLTIGITFPLQLFPVAEIVERWIGTCTN